MHRRTFQGLLVAPLTMLVALTSVTSYGDPLVLCVAVGDHHHLLIGREHTLGFSHSHGAQHDYHQLSHGDCPSSHDDFDHADGAAEPHEHTCIDILLLGGDLQPQSRKSVPASNCTEALMVAAQHVLLMPPIELHRPGSARIPAHKWSPPDLLRTTVLLI